MVILQQSISLSPKSRKCSQTLGLELGRHEIPFFLFQALFFLSRHLSNLSVSASFYFLNLFLSLAHIGYGLAKLFLGPLECSIGLHSQCLHPTDSCLCLGSDCQDSFMVVWFGVKYQSLIHLAVLGGKDADKEPCLVKPLVVQ